MAGTRRSWQKLGPQESKVHRVLQMMDMPGPRIVEHYAAPAAVVECVKPASAFSNVAASQVMQYIAPASEVSYAALAPGVSTSPQLRLTLLLCL